MGLGTILAIVALVLALIAIALPFAMTEPSSTTTTTTTQGTPNVSYYAIVAANGSFVTGYEANNSTLLSTGTYIVTFDVALNGCTYQGGFGTTGISSAGPGVVTVVPSAAPHNSTWNVTVTTYNNTNKSLANQSFHVVATCPGGLWAIVGPHGAILNGAGVDLATHRTTGNYVVAFDRNVVGCAYIGGWGSDLSSSPGGTLGLASRSGNPDAVWVDSYTTAGTAADTTFHLSVYC